MSKSNRYKQATRPKWLIPAVLAIVAVTLGGLALVLLRGNQPAYAPQVTGRANLEVDQAVLDFGDVRFNTPVNAVFRLRNTGDRLLTIFGEPRVELLQGC